MTDFDALNQHLIADFPYGVLNTDTGFQVYRLHGNERMALLCQLVHDTSREDPTLVLDVLRETHDPERVRKFWSQQFVAFFPTLEMAVQRIGAHETRYLWERKHIEECHTAYLTAERNYRAAQQSQKHTVWNEFDRFGGCTFTDACIASNLNKKENTMLTITDPKTNKTFTAEPISRDAYLAQRAEWKAEYADLSNKIRETKAAIKEASRNNDPSAGSLQRKREILRDYATAALETRRQQKLIAAASYAHFRKEQKVAA